MEYDQYQKLRQEFFSGKKRSGLEGKLLKKEQYTPTEQADITYWRMSLKSAMSDAESERRRWHSMLDTQDLRPQSPIAVARMVHSSRYSRKTVRARVRICEQMYRMAWEVPFLLAQESRRSAKRTSFLPPVFHNVKFDMPILAARDREPLSSLRAIERRHQQR